MLLLEQGQLSCGTTWHAAGLVGQLRASESGTRLVQYSTELYAGWRPRPGWRPGTSECGGVTVARTAGPDDPAAPHRGRSRGLRPGVRADQPAAGPGALPGDAGRRPGRRDLAARRRQGQPDRPDHGAGQGRPAAGRTDRRADPGHRRPDRAAARVTGVRTDQGDVEAEIVVNCAGQWAKQVGAHGRGHRAAALGRALLRGHRADRRRPPRPADAARPGRLHLLQGGGRRPGRRRLRAGGQAVGRRPTRSPTRSSSSCSTRTGTTSRS